MRNPIGLLGSGLQSAGGLLGRGLQAMGRNFDRNAIGGIDKAMGDEFTQDTRRGLRSNAIMALGQMLATQGRTPIQEGLQRGQEKTLGAWKIGRERRQEDENKRMWADMGQSMLGNEAGTNPPASTAMVPVSSVPAVSSGRYNPNAASMPGAGAPAVAAPVDPLAPLHQEIAQLTQIRTHAKQMMAQSLIKGNMAGYKMAADTYKETTDQLLKYQQEIRQSQPELHSIDKGVDASGNPVKMFVMKNGEVRTDPRFGLSPDLMIIDRDGVKTLIDKNATKPQDFSTVEGATNQANRMQDLSKHIWQREMDTKNYKLNARQTATGERNAGTSSFLGTLAMMRENREGAKDLREQFTPKPLSGEASKVNAIATTMEPELRALRGAYVLHGVNASRGISTGINRELVDLVGSISDKIGRLRSGGAISAEEADRFMSQIHHWTNSLPLSGPGASIKGIDRYLREAELVRQGIDPSKRSASVSPSLPASATPNLTRDLLGFKPKE